DVDMDHAGARIHDVADLVTDAREVGRQDRRGHAAVAQELRGGHRADATRTGGPVAGAPAVELTTYSAASSRLVLAGLVRVSVGVRARPALTGLPRLRLWARPPPV